MSRYLASDLQRQASAWLKSANLDAGVLSQDTLVANRKAHRVTTAATRLQVIDCQCGAMQFDGSRLLWSDSAVKTIDISDTAFVRLEVWKENGQDTFTNVILRTVPPKGAFEAALAAARFLPELTPEQEQELLEVYEENRQPAGDSWLQQLRAIPDTLPEFPDYK